MAFFYFDKLSNTEDKAYQIYPTKVPNHSGLFLFDFVDSPSAYKKLLLSLSGIIIPTNGCQISPQLSSATALGLKVLSDCGFQLLFHDDYQIMNPSFSNTRCRPSCNCKKQ